MGKIGGIYYGENYDTIHTKEITVEEEGIVVYFVVVICYELT